MCSVRTNAFYVSMHSIKRVPSEDYVMLTLKLFIYTVVRYAERSGAQGADVQDMPRVILFCRALF